MNIGDNIKKYRKQNKLTQKELGDLINKSTISIRKYESNKIVPSLGVLDDISKALNVPVNYLSARIDIDISKIETCKLVEEIEKRGYEIFVKYSNINNIK